MALKRLEPHHEIAIEWLSKPKRGGKTLQEVADLAGVTPQAICKWRKDPLFERELKAAMIRNNQDRLPELIESLADIAIRDGNAAMAKLALQINGMLTDKVEVETKGKSDDIDLDEMKAKIEAFRKRKEAESTSD
jgi:hypothetical protein